MGMTKRAKMSFLLGAALLLVWFVMLRPFSLGGPAVYIIVAGSSMEPALHSGDLTVMQRHNIYAQGDIVAFMVRDSIVTHRIVGGTATEGYIVQGDNKEAPDQWRPTADQILGRMWLHVPHVGRYLLILRQPWVFAIVVGALACLLLFPLPRRETRHEKRRRQHRLKVLRRRKERALARWLPFPAARLVSRLD